MKHVEVTLETHQRAVVEIEVDDDADRDEMRQAALAKLDESGGAEWETLYGEELFEVIGDKEAAEAALQELIARLGLQPGATS